MSDPYVSGFDVEHAEPIGKGVASSVARGFKEGKQGYSRPFVHTASNAVGNYAGRAARARKRTGAHSASGGAGELRMVTEHGSPLSTGRRTRSYRGTH